MTRASTGVFGVFGAAVALSLIACACTRAAVRASPPSVYVITGASSGFGRGVALSLAAEHASVVLVARRAEVLRDVADQVAALGGSAVVAPADVTDPRALEAVSKIAIARFGRIDVWINDAGVGAVGRFDQIPVEDQARVVDVNLKGVIFGSAAALQVFRHQGFGTLINIGSIDSEVPLAYQATYAATKAAVLSLGRSLNEELRLSGQHSVRVSTVLPWASDTPWWLHAANYTGRVPAMIGIDPPDPVVKAIVRTAKRPREEVLVGWKSRSAYWAHRLAPDLTERTAANIAHRVQMVDAPPSPATSGAVFTPKSEGHEVEGAWRDAIREGPDLCRGNAGSKCTAPGPNGK